MSAPRIIAVCGSHGAGKDTLARGLSKELGAQCFTHTKPRGPATAWEAALWYAVQRAKLYSVSGDGLIVASRWHWSSLVFSNALDVLAQTFTREGELLGELHRIERRAIGDPLVTLVCDAPEAVLHARLAERGETWGARESAERAEVLRLARIRSWPVIDTTRDRDVVLAEALGIVRGVL